MSIYCISSHRVNKLPKADPPGGWYDRDLQDVAADLNAGDGAGLRENTRSVPDAWAQVLLTRDALFDDRDPLHLDIEAQWRALLATVALAPFYKHLYSLSVVAIEPGGGALADLLLDPALVPTTTIAAASTWRNSVAALQFTAKTTGRQNLPAQTIGLAVPDIILAPGRGFAKLRIVGVPWLENGPVDPAAIAVSAMQMALLARHVGDMAAAARALPAGPPAVMDERKLLTACLDRFAAECKARTHGDLTTRPGASSGLGWPAPLGAVLAVPPDLMRDPAQGESDCKLKRRDDIGGLGLTSIILADPALATAIRPAHMIRLFDTYSLADAAVQLPQIKAEAAAHGHIILTPDDLLTDILVEQTKGSVKGHMDMARGHFLPVTPLALLLMPGDALARAAIIRPQGAAVQAGFTVEMADGSRHELVRDYAGDRLRSVERLANFGMWPDFAADDWHHYGVRAQANPLVEPCLVFAGSGKVVAADLAQTPVGGRLARIASWPRLRGLDASREQVFGDGTVKLAQFPLSDPSASNTASLQAWSSVPIEALFMTLGGEAAGCVVPPVPRLADTLPGQTAKVAVDFGTSNTIVRWTRNGVAQHARALPTRVVQPIAPLDGAAPFDSGVRTSFLDFLPIEEQAMPFPTMIKERTLPTPITGDTACSYQSIFFADTVIAAGDVTTLLGQIAGNTIQANIKWDDTPIGIMRSTRFLRQLVMMIAADLRHAGLAPGQVAWRFSYPSAFLPQQQQAFFDLIRPAVADVCGGGVSDVAFHPESTAAKEALAVGGAVKSVSSLVVMLDIGGGTTDIAVWRGTETLWQGSFRIAARRFFTDSLLRYPSILATTGVLDAAATQQLRDWTGAGLDEGAGTLAARNLVELTIGGVSFDARFRTAMRSNAAVAEWRALQNVAMTALGGMLWYLGRLFKARIAAGEWQLTDAEIASATVALAGRGASYFQHLDPDRQVILPKLLKLLTIAAGIDGEPDGYFSDTPKQEVVVGLLALETDTAIGDPGRSPSILGEALSYGGQRWDADTNLDAVAMPSVTPDVGVDEMRGFLSALKRQVGVDIDLLSRTRQGTLQGAVTSAMRAPFRSPTGRPVADAIETPLFILGLGALVDELVRR